MLVLKGLVVLHRIIQLQLLQHYWLGHRLGLLVAATGALSMAEKNYPTSEVRGRKWENPMPEGRGQEALPHV